MRRARRTVFAAAWIVVGCSSAPPRSAPRVAMASADAGVPDAAPAPPIAIDAAAAPDAPWPRVAAVPQPDPCSLPFDPQHPVYCNPPAGGLQGNIVETEVTDGGRVRITIGRGTSDGVDRDWVGSIDGMRDSHFMVFNVREHECSASVKASIDEIHASSMKVTLLPPP